MRTKYNICSKLWHDINIDFVRKNIRHCCKSSRDFIIKQSEIDTLGYKVFDLNFVALSARKAMVERNVLPQVCLDCKKSEPNSIRHVWNKWSDKYIEEHKDDLLTSFQTNYVEFDIGNQCDLACVYCGPWSSTTWAKELKHGRTKNEMDLLWKTSILENLLLYLKELPKDTRMTFNVLGGEPTLINETYEIIDRLKTVCDHFDHKPNMMITTNLNTKPKLMNRFINTIKETNHLFSWNIAISIEDIGERAEAIRYGLDWKRFEKNVKNIKEVADIVYLTTTINLMNLPYFSEFIDWSFKLLGSDDYSKKWMFSTNSVQNGYSDIAFLKKHQVDIDQIKKTLLMHSSEKPNTTKNMIDHLSNLNNRLGTKKVNEEFKLFWEELSDRRNLQYAKIFPVIKDLISDVQTDS